ncbi:Uncharacterised protein [Klebsiella pneumoniae]|nr:Uncharacterised protein [Klebsiella pneumoniae]SWV03418.1 Uncharacterised protein [Klebsiella pneumoniae]SXB15621.1 Uncharacterised protein [Klebsiella pneumoniae]SXU57846.1 Uncharacterised protein [Klebsiella pneumoniae]VUI06391.1 Uncharacterised protein [Klebsiella pneumoniae]
MPDGGINALSGLRSFLRAPPRTGKRSAAGRSGSIPAIVPDGGIHALSGLRSFLRAHPHRTGKRSAAGRSGAVPAIVPDGGINALSGLRSFLRAPPQDRQAQRRRAGHFKLHTCGSAGWRHTCLIRPTFLPAGSPPRTGKRSAAGQLAHPPSVHRQAQGQILRVGVKIVLRLQVAIRILGQIVLKQRQRGEDRQQPGAIVEDHLPQLAALAAV